MKVCILGASGFIGRSVLNEVKQLGIDHIAISRKGDEESGILPIAIQDKSKIKEIFNEYPFVINAIGSLKPANFENSYNSSMNTWWEAFMSLISGLEEAKIKKIVHISSGGSIYGECILPKSETDTLNPKSWYGKIKLLEEKLIREYALKNNIPHIISRVSNPFGKTEFKSHGIIDAIIHCARNKKPFKVQFDPKSTRDFIYINDLAKVLLKQLVSNKTGTYNVGTGVSSNLVSILENAKQLSNGFEISYANEINDYNVIESKLNISKLKSDFNLLSFVDVNEYLSNAIKSNYIV